MFVVRTTSTTSWVRNPEPKFLASLLITSYIHTTYIYTYRHSKNALCYNKSSFQNDATLVWFQNDIYIYDIHIHTHIHIHTLIHVHIHVNIHMHTYHTHAYTNTYTYKHTYAYISHTHTHAHLFFPGLFFVSWCSVLESYTFVFCDWLGPRPTHLLGTTSPLLSSSVTSSISCGMCSLRESCNFLFSLELAQQLTPVVVPTHDRK